MKNHMKKYLLNLKIIKKISGIYNYRIESTPSKYFNYIDSESVSTALVFNKDFFLEIFLNFLPNA